MRILFFAHLKIITGCPEIEVRVNNEMDADQRRCDLIVTTGGTGISARDVTPEATREVLAKELPGFGEIMRRQSFATVRTAILSRATAGTRGTSLIVNLPSKPSAVAECLAILAPALREGIAHLRGLDPHLKPLTTTL